MKRPRRKWLVTLQMRSGACHRIICRNFDIKKSVGDGNSLASMTATGGKLPFYTRLDAIDSITARRNWLRWYFA